ncbi:structural maintenance of chromosome 4 [Paragonimus westermani]|uniref:Structural maintenance of chromosomes protein n=1 Tax=Paragonimus westermani TaxID=34504 RepID=A0A5J4NKA5_9TREM|nr:structural maintenance of chromosome 4 [Paragonimus westermani]
MTADAGPPAFDNDEDIINNCTPIEIPPPPQPAQTLDASGPRLMITKIDSENFKSYGGFRSMGPFHKNFSCIIGPNGSGKSNVIDSMLFVFGYRATKVRSKKLSQLIHHSETVPNAGSCMVAVHFQKIIEHGPEPLNYEVVPNSSFVVTRRAYRDNSSTYWIDNTRAVYRDVATLLRSHGVDLDHNRFLILQGEVEQIALMKPKAPSEHEDGFLEYLEDIIGSSRFKQPLAIFTDRIERLNDLRLEKLTRVKAVEKEKDDLEGVRNEAMGYLRLVNQVIRMKNILFQQNLAKERAAVSETSERIAAVQSECQTLAADLKEKSTELAKTEAERDQLVERHTELLKRHRETKNKFSEFEAEDSRLRDEHAHVKAMGRRLTKALQVERNKLEEMERLPEETESRKLTILKQLAELEETKKKHELAYQETVDSLEKETAPLRAKVEAAEITLAPLQIEADELSSKLTLERQQFDLLMTGQRREQERANKARQGASIAQTKLQQREAEMAEAKKNLASSTTQANRRQSSQIGNLVVGLAAATRDLNEVRTKEAELTKELNELRTKLAESKSTLQADTSRGRVFNALLEAKRAGSLPGILGRLGDLAAIPSRYDVAISTACSALDHIVTDTMDTAQQAVTFLKQNNLGLATFIGLDKMQKWAEKSKSHFTLPTGDFQVQRLYDLVQTVDDTVKPALYFALRDTLVTDTMDTALKVAFSQRQRHRVVTLQGQLIETSGAMSGGGGRPLSGRMLTSLAQVREYHGTTKACLGAKPVSDDVPDLPALERQLATGDADLARLRENRARLEEVVTRLSRQRDEAEQTAKRCEAECARLRAEMATLTAEADRAQERANSVGPSAAEQKRLQAELQELEKTVQQKCDQAAKKRAEVESLKTQLLDVGSVRLTAVRSRLDAIDKKAKETNDQLTKLEVSVKTAARNYEKAQTKVANMEAELEAAKKKLTEVDGKLKELEENARVCMVAFQKIQADVEQLQKSKEEAQAKLTELETSLVALQKSETVARRNLTQLETELSQSTAKARQWQRELRGLRLHKLDDESDDESTLVDSQVDPVTSQPNNTEIADIVVSSPPLAKMQRKSTDLPIYSNDQLQELTVDMQEMRSLEDRLASMAPNMAAIEEFRRKAEIYLTRVGELNHVTAVLGEQRKQMEDAKAKRLSEFLDGGDAELELIDSLDPFSEGIVFSVRPPKKSWKNIANLSGGEKTLSSLALVFALHHYKPTPLYVMDEIDAALDFKNVSIVGNYLKERTRNAQFIVISLRNNMFELADRLVGIYKTQNVTKTITLDHARLTEQLSKMVVRVATAHGREKDLLKQQQSQQPHMDSARPVASQSVVPDAFALITSQPTFSSNVFLEGHTQEYPIVIGLVSFSLAVVFRSYGLFHGASS